MNFAALPPEINSLLMYAGPGAEPMLAAATAWDGLAGELHAAAAGYRTVITGLTGSVWRGPSAAAMAAAAEPYIDWLSAAGVRAELTANQARSAAGAYQAAFAMTVPPGAVVANRMHWLALIATNLFGQNTPAIALDDADYGEMWARDVAAMHGYAAAAATTQPTAFDAPVQTADGGVGLHSLLAQVVQAMTGGAHQLAAAPAQSLIPDPISDLFKIEGALAPGLTAVSIGIGSSAWNAAANNSRLLLANTNRILDNHDVLLDTEQQLLRGEDDIKAMLGRLRSAGWTSALPGVPRAPLPVFASLARALPVGNLSVPLGWAAATPEWRSAVPLPAGPAVTAAPAGVAGPAGTLFGQTALAGMGGSALAGGVSRGQGERSAAAALGEPARIVAGTAAEPSEPPAEHPLTELVTGIRELGELRDAGLLTAEEFTEQKQRLLDRPLQ